MTEVVPVRDPHSHHMPGQPVPYHVEALIGVDFTQQRLYISQTISFDRVGEVFLDCRDQMISSISDDKGSIDFTVEGDPESVLGAYVRVVVPPSKTLKMSYHTGPGAKGLQWLTPGQAGSDYAMLYSQFEAINGRSVFVLPDSPNIRFTYKMTLKVPPTMRGLMSASTQGETTTNGEARYEEWIMEYPVPLYLVAINVGDFIYQSYDDVCGVWAGPKDMPRAYDALKRTPEVLKAEEKLFGRYRWGAYRTVVLPQRGYPYGAMEHPCLTSMNAMLTTDESDTTRVTIHEMVHSWFGNLITNRTWNDFWLNEGVTTFGEWLALREVYGEEEMRLQIALARKELNGALKDFAMRGVTEMGRLKTDLDGKDPDAYFSRVPYVKGALFLWTLMENVGEARMLEFLRAYIDEFEFESIDTEEFLRFAKSQFGESELDAVNADAWIYEPGLPDYVPENTSRIEAQVRSYAEHSQIPPQAIQPLWRSQEWKLYFTCLDRSGKNREVLKILNRRHNFSRSPNGMLQVKFLLAALESHDTPPTEYLDEVRQFLISYGRTVYLRPLYTALCRRGLTQEASDIFEEAAAGYHPVGQEVVASILKEYGLAAA